MNIPNTLTVIDRLRNTIDDSEFDMKVWMSKRHNDGHPCGTTACLAGHAILAAAGEGLIQRFEYRPADGGYIYLYDEPGIAHTIHTAGQKYLELNDNQARLLFKHDALMSMSKNQVANILEHMVQNDGAYPQWLTERIVII